MRLFLAFAVSLSAMPALSDEATEACQEWRDMAFGVMTDRQADVPLPEAMAKLDSLPDAKREAAEALISEAYIYASYDNESMKKGLPVEFSERVFNRCYLEVRSLMK